MQQKEGNQRVLLWIGTFMQKIFNLFEKPGGFFFFFFSLILSLGNSCVFKSPHHHPISLFLLGSVPVCPLSSWPPQSSPEPPALPALRAAVALPGKQRESITQLRTGEMI